MKFSFFSYPLIVALNKIVLLNANGFMPCIIVSFRIRLSVFFDY